jgi:hypothetical protein
MIIFLNALYQSPYTMDRKMNLILECCGDRSWPPGLNENAVSTILKSAANPIDHLKFTAWVHVAFKCQREQAQETPWWRFHHPKTTDGPHDVCE